MALWQHISLAPLTKRIRFHLVPSYCVEDDALTRRGHRRHESAQICVIKRKMCRQIVRSKLLYQQKKKDHLSCKSQINVTETLKITMDESKERDCLMQLEGEQTPSTNMQHGVQLEDRGFNNRNIKGVIPQQLLEAR